MRYFVPFLFALALLNGAERVAIAGCMPGRDASNMTAPAHALAASLRGKPVFARIHADWCPACKATQPTIDALRAKYSSSVTFVEFDVTDAKTSAAAAAKAKALGLAAFYEANKTATSTVAILNPDDGTTVAKFYNDADGSDYDKAIRHARSELRSK